MLLQLSPDGKRIERLRAIANVDQNGPAEPISIGWTTDEDTRCVGQAARADFDRAVSLPVVNIADATDQELFLYITSRCEVDRRFVHTCRHERMGSRVNDNRSGCFG